MKHTHFVALELPNLLINGAAAQVLQSASTRGLACRLVDIPTSEHRISPSLAKHCQCLTVFSMRCLQYTCAQVNGISDSG